jgi:hypothetical protein
LQSGITCWPANMSKSSCRPVFGIIVEWASIQGQIPGWAEWPRASRYVVRR